MDRYGGPLAAGTVRRETADMPEYRYPPAGLLKDSTESSRFQRLEYVRHLKDNLDGMFSSFGMDVKVVDYQYNNFAILMKLQPGENITPRKIRNIRADIELHMANPVEILESADDSRIITIAVKNIQRPVVPLKEVMQSAAFREAKSPLAVAAGIDLFGSALVFDIAGMPNLLVAGVTGAGKSVFLHDIILSILYRARPDEVRLLLFDMKKIEFPLLNDIPHMMQPAVVDTDTGMDVLMALRDEKDRRLYEMARANTACIEDYNAKAAVPLPRIVVIIDEYMEFIIRKTDEEYEKERVEMFNAVLEEIAAQSRAAGIHLILATQRPSPDIITDRIKAALPCRASFVVVDGRESRIILNRTGAERLLGQGDMILTRNDSGEGIHAQAAYVSDEEINRVIGFLCGKDGGEQAEESRPE